MSFTQVKTTNLDTTIVTQIDAGVAASTAVASIVSMAIANVQVASNSSYTTIDDTAVGTAGGYVVINGSGFVANSTVIIGTVNATSTTYVSSSVLQAQVPAQAAASYPLYVVAPNGSTAIRVNGITYSAFPAWSTGSALANQASATSFGVNLAATGDGSITYANTTPLPAGTTLAANGFFYGTVTIGSQTTYSFDVLATDTENQDTSRTFSLTVTVTPQYKLWSWGRGVNGGLGLNDTASRSSPVQVGTNTTWSTSGVAMAIDMGFAIKTDGTLWSWGSNSFGGLGQNNAVLRSSPTQVGALTNWSKIATHANFSIATKTDGTLWAWGANSNGQLGDGTVINRSSPVQIGAGTTWLKISTGNYNSLAIKTDGTFWAWGNGQRLPHNSPFSLSRSSPVQIGFDMNWSDIAAGANVFLALRTDGTLWSWGNNYYGALGISAGQQDPRSSPVQVGTDTNWSSIAMGEHLASAIKTNGTLWSWGFNDAGQLGLNDRVYRSSPVQVGVGTTWLKITNSYFQLAIKTDGTLWSWGYNSFGQLGLNDSVMRSSPVQIGTNTNWSNITNGAYGTLAVTTN